MELPIKTENFIRTRNGHALGGVYIPKFQRINSFSGPTPHNTPTPAQMGQNLAWKVEHTTNGRLQVNSSTPDFTLSVQGSRLMKKET